MPLTEEMKIKNKERSKLYYTNEENKLKHNEYMREYHKKNRELLKEYKNQLKTKTEN
jgi:hypothetical protein